VSFLIEKYAFRQGCCTAQPHTPDGVTQRVIVRGPCYQCGTEQAVEVDGHALLRFRDGCFAQDCFPDLPAEKREFLISGICGTCWDEMFPDAEAETEEE
jgi:hypothetical protein